MEKAEEAFKKSLSCCTDKARYHHLLAGYYQQRKDFKNSEIEFIRALEESPDHSDILWDFACFHKKHGQIKEAIDLLEKLIILNPEHEKAFFDLGNLYLQINQFEKADLFYNKTIKLNPSHSGAKTNLALCLRKLGQFDKAIRLCEEVLQDQPLSIAALSNMAYAYYGLGSHEQAAETFKTIIKHDPNYLDAHVFLAHIFLMNNQVEECVGSCDHILKLLGMERDIILESLEDLGKQFIKIANKLHDNDNPFLSDICLALGQILTSTEPAS